MEEKVGRQEKCWRCVCVVCVCVCLCVCVWMGIRFGENIYDFFFTCSTWFISVSSDPFISFTN